MPPYVPDIEARYQEAETRLAVPFKVETVFNHDGRNIMVSWSRYGRQYVVLGVGLDEALRKAIHLEETNQDAEVEPITDWETLGY